MMKHDPAAPAHGAATTRTEPPTMPNRALPILTTLLLAVPMLAWPCLTSDRARALGMEHPDLGFERLAEEMHHRPRIDYDFAGAADCVDGQADGFECRGIRLAGWLPLPEIGGGSGADNWGWAHEPTGRLFALMGRSNGTAFVEVTDPDQPVYLGNLPRPDGVPVGVLTDIKTYRNHALIVADNAPGQGIQFFDLTRLLDVGDAGPVTFEEDVHYTGFNDAHNIAVNEESGYAYAVGGEQCNGGLVMVDIRQPSNPTSAGCYRDDGYTHDVQCVIYRGPDADYQGREICFASNEDSLTLVDVTDKAAPTLIARHLYDHAYTHQGWLTGDQRYFFLDDELDERNQDLSGTRTLVFDLVDLDQADPPAEYIADRLTIDHNQYVIGDYIFQANYQQGLRVMRIDDPDTARLTEVAWFDTHPGADALSFDGAWSVFPYFGRNIVLVSDINRGLFILEVTDAGIADALRDALFADWFQSP
jgi:choice-of-anchor B domain-containing protein